MLTSGRFLAGLTMAAFSLQAAAQSKLTLTTLYNFNDPLINLTTGLVETSGLLYGTTSLEGEYQSGTVYSIDPVSGSQSTVYSFTGGTDGGYPSGDLVVHAGMLYGVTSDGGLCNGCGTLFSINPATGAEATLFSFDIPDGVPEGGLLYYAGSLYGLTSSAVFKFDLETREFIAWHTFRCNPLECRGALIAYKGSLYGTSSQGGGAVFRIDPATGALTVLHEFTSTRDGSYPLGPLVQLNGVLYGTTNGGGWPFRNGTVFSIDPATGAEKIVKQFSRINGNEPYYGGLLPINGILYGTTGRGGTHDFGTIYSLDPVSGKERVLYSFTDGTDGGFPSAGLTLYSGSLFSTTAGGTVFRLSRNP